MEAQGNQPADMSDDLIKAIPKVELHIHLEGAIPIGTLFRLIQRKGTEPSIRTVGDLRQRLEYVDFAHFIELWTWKNTFIEAERDFEAITHDALRDLTDQNVKYAEITYAPGDYWRQGLSIEGITENIIEGKQRALEDFGIQSELIVDLVRDHGPDIGMQRVQVLSRYLGKGLVGIGLGGSEQSFPADPYEPVYKHAAERGFRLTAHAGEAAGPESIWAAIDKLNVERIGHGTRAYEDPLLLSTLRERKIPLEMCVLSNVRTRVCPSIVDHPIRTYFEQGLLVTANSDDPTMFNTSIAEEYAALHRHLGFSLADLKEVSLNGIEASFMPVAQKAAMRDIFESEWLELQGRAGQ